MDSFDTLLESHLPMLRRLTAYRLPPADAEDVLQEICLALLPICSPPAPFCGRAAPSPPYRKSSLRNGSSWTLSAGIP